jgi:hypothetical protein
MPTFYDLGNERENNLLRKAAHSPSYDSSMKQDKTRTRMYSAVLGNEPYFLLLPETKIVRKKRKGKRHTRTADSS